MGELPPERLCELEKFWVVVDELSHFHSVLENQQLITLGEERRAKGVFGQSGKMVGILPCPMSSSSIATFNPDYVKFHFDA